MIPGHEKPDRHSPRLRVIGVALFGATLAVLGSGAWARDGAAAGGKEVYARACAACHGPGGRGVSQARLGFDAAVPDFTDCSFATREATADWVAVAHEGGPVRGFSRFMPSFGVALSVAELEAAIGHIRSFCRSDAWPRGEFNLPRALATTKAFPEDEVVVVLDVDADEPSAIETEVIFEKRVGARNQVELALPMAWLETATANGDGSDDWRSVLGDLALGYKRVLYDDLDSGAIWSFNAELILPTGDEESGFGGGTTLFEPQLLYGQILPRGFFLQAQAGLGLPLEGDADEEAFWRAAMGGSFNEGRWGRRWTPMLEVTGVRALTDGADTEWDLLPQLQVTLSQRQHVRLSVGARVPVSQTDTRDTRIVVYVLWDFFDGGLLEGW